MTTTQLKPWSQVEESDASESTLIAPAPIGPANADPILAPTAAAPGPQRASAQGTRSLPLGLALVPLTLAVGWTLWGAIHPAASGSAAHLFQSWGSVAVTVTGVGWLMAALRARRNNLARLASHLSRAGTDFESSAAAAKVPSEFRGLWWAIAQHKATVESRLDELMAQQRDLALERSLSEMQKRHIEAIIDSISDAVLVTDAFDRIALANPAAEAIFGFDRADALRESVTNLIEDAAFQQALRQVRDSTGSTPKRRFEHQIGTRTYAITLSRVSAERQGAAPDVEAHGVVAVLRDITKDQEIARLKSEFVAHVSHELRTPLSSIRAYVEMLVDGEANSEETQREYYDIIQSSADRLGRLIDNMLNISRIESGTVRINKEPVAISMVVKDALDVMRPQAEEKGIALTDELTPVMYRVEADRDMLYQAVLNLISNAIKYTPDGGTVQVRMTPHEERHTIAIAVRDSGAGIPKDAMPHMFEKFFRVEANKKLAKGTGLGLNLVKHIVETVHAGKVSVTSEVGKGSTFEMTVPLMA